MDEMLTQQELIDRSIFGSTRELDYFLKQAVSGIDKQFGDGYAKNNPALVGAYLQAATAMSTCVGAGTIETAADKIAGAIEELANAIGEVFSPDE